MKDAATLGYLWLSWLFGCFNDPHRLFLESYECCYMNSTTFFAIYFLSKLSTQKYVYKMSSGVSGSKSNRIPDWWYLFRQFPFRMSYNNLYYDLIYQQYLQHVFDLSYCEALILLENILVLQFFLSLLHVRKPVRKNRQVYPA